VIVGDARASGNLAAATILRGRDEGEDRIVIENQTRVIGEQLAS
jgi:hypothetical protein